MPRTLTSTRQYLLHLYPPWLHYKYACTTLVSIGPDETIEKGAQVNYPKIISLIKVAVFLYAPLLQLIVVQICSNLHSISMLILSVTENFSVITQKGYEKLMLLVSLVTSECC